MGEGHGVGGVVGNSKGYKVILGFDNEAMIRDCEGRVHKNV